MTIDRMIDLGEFVDWSWNLKQERDQLKVENQSLRKDAERYRWLRQQNIPLDGHDFLSTQEILDRRIDAAMLKEQPK